MTTAQQSTINPAFAGYAAQQLQEATGGIQRVFDNLLDIARGNDPTANGYDRLRATRVLYDRGFGKVTKNRPQPEQAPGHNDHHVGALREAPAASNRPAARLEQKLDDALGSPQPPAQPNPAHPERSPVLSPVEGPVLSPVEGAAESKEPVLSLSKDTPTRLDEPGHVPNAPGYIPDLVREAQFYVLEITKYGAELAYILAYIHEPDPDDTSIRLCHRIAAGQMILDRVIGTVADLEQPLDHWHDPSLEPAWITKHPAELDSTIPLEKIIEADRLARQLIDDCRRTADDPCEDCTNERLCEFHDPESSLYEDPHDEEQLLISARTYRNMRLFRDRIYLDRSGAPRLRPPPHIDDS